MLNIADKQTTTPVLGYALSGPIAPYDPRVTPLRGDLAALALAGTHFAPHYVEPDIRTVAAGGTMVRAEGDAAATAVSQLLAGEEFALLDEAGGWAWGYCRHDRYCGYVPVDALLPRGTVAPAASHVVHRRAAPVFAQPSIKAPVQAILPMGARLAVEGASDCGQFLATTGGYVHARHATPLNGPALDPVECAMQLLGAPYVWGGRSGEGLDCSGLVQLCLALAGLAAPRDSDQQMAALGRPLAESEPLARGDLVFFPGHVGIMADGERLIHANAHWMQVVVEPLADVVARFPADVPQPILARKRLG